MNVNLTWGRKKKALTEDRQDGMFSADYADHKWELYKAVMVSVLSEGADRGDTSYRQAWQSLKPLIRKNSPVFVAKLAIYMQEQMHCREISFLLSAALAVEPGNGAGVDALTKRLLQQPAWIAEWLEFYAMIYQDHHGKTFHRAGRQLVKMLSTVFCRLDEFQYTRFDKWQQDRFRKALLLVKPVAKDRSQQALFRKILKDQLPARRMWQEELDAVRKQHYDSPALKRAALKEMWETLILSWKISYNDLLDQLPAILQAGASGKALQLLGQYLGNAGAVAKNGYLASRYLEASRNIRSLGHHRTGPLLEALEQAAILSAANIKGFTADTRVLIAMDVSNSMKRAVEEDRSVDRFDIAPLLGISLQYRCTKLITGLFGNIWKQIGLPEKSMLREMDSFHSREGEVGYAANGYLVIGELIRKNLITDKILIFTDCRLWNNRQPNQSPGTDVASLWRQYKQMAPHAQLYLFDLAAYGNSSLEVLPDDVYLVAGWNDRIFDVLQAVEKNLCAVEGVDFTISF